MAFKVLTRMQGPLKVKLMLKKIQSSVKIGRNVIYLDDRLTFLLASAQLRYLQSL